MLATRSKLRYRGRRSAGVVVRTFILLSLLGITVLLKSENADPGGDENGRDYAKSRDPRSRHLLSAPVSKATNKTLGITYLYDNVNGTDGYANESATTEETLICTSPAYHEFPPDVFTTKERRDGALALHFLLVIYMFTALAIVCDVYFVASLEKISDKLNLSEDVAGATFMAGGSSAPELFTSILGVFVTKGDVGVGTIVGSAVFNILFVIGLCGVLVTQVVRLSWFPLVRDSTFYLLSVIILILSILDSKIVWYEASIMLFFYAMYITIMKFNPIIQSWAVSTIHVFDKQEDASKILPPGEASKYYNTYEMFQNEDAKTPTSQPNVQPFAQPNGQAAGQLNGQPGSGPPAVIAVDEYVLKSTRKVSFEDACFRFMKGRRFRGRTRFRSAAYIIVFERRKLVRDDYFMRRQKLKTFSYDSEANSYTKAVRTGHSLEEEPDLADEWKRLPTSGDGILFILKWVATLPLNILLYYTIPDCRQQRWDKWFMLTFGMSIVWIAIFSYVMVWMVALIGFTLGIPDSIMGITFLAAGTSVPDAMASVMVARQGHGDMAVSNTIGSNVFDILVGLAVPWFLQTAVISAGSVVHINSNGMIFSVVLLFMTVVITICSVHFTGWKLDKKVGLICLFSYGVFLVFSTLIEFNIFGYVNPPMCRE